jgi:hypothetical protein
MAGLKKEASGAGRAVMDRQPCLGTQADFESLSLHDDTVYGLRFDTAEPESGLWRADLVIDIDHIVEWVCAPGQRARFKVAPANLSFHDVTDLALAIDWGDSGHRTMLGSIAIDRLERQPVPEPRICMGGPYYRWTIALNCPKDGRITFGASGFTLALRAPPILSDEQQLSHRLREASAPHTAHRSNIA